MELQPGTFLSARDPLTSGGQISREEQSFYRMKMEQVRESSVGTRKVYCRQRRKKNQNRDLGLEIITLTLIVNTNAS